MQRHTDRDPGRQKDRQTGGPCSNQEQHPSCSPCVMSIRNEVRFVRFIFLPLFSVIPPFAALFFCLLIVASFLFFFLFCFFFLSFVWVSFPPLCPWCVPTSQGTVPMLPDEDQAVCSLVCMCVYWCMQIGLFGGQRQLQTLVCGITAMWWLSERPAATLSFEKKSYFINLDCEKKKWKRNKNMQCPIRKKGKQSTR